MCTLTSFTSEAKKEKGNHERRLHLCSLGTCLADHCNWVKSTGKLRILKQKSTIVFSHNFLPHVTGHTLPHKNTRIQAMPRESVIRLAKPNS